METPDLERIRFITRHFNDLQGLRYGVPLGLILLAWTGPPSSAAPASWARCCWRSGPGGTTGPSARSRESRSTSTRSSIRRPSSARPVRPAARDAAAGHAGRQRFFVTALLAGVVFAYILALPPGNFVVQGDGSLRRTLLAAEPVYAPPWLSRWAYSRTAERSMPPSMFRAVCADGLPPRRLLLPHPLALAGATSPRALI